MLPRELFRPKSVAVIGATSKTEKAGYGVFANMIDAGYDGRLIGVNPGGGSVKGIPLLKSIDEIDGTVDLGVFIVPPKAILEGIPKLAAKGMKAAVVISAGFKEIGGEGAELEKALAAVAAKCGVRVLGPNCLGLIDCHSRVNASFSNGTPKAGPIAFFSQSGALCTAILDWALGEGIGFSKFVSLGNKADISESDIMETLASDDETRVILGYVESIDDGVRFLEAAKRVTPMKPIVILKAGATAAGARAASSHTGSLAGSDHAYSAAFHQSGVIRAETVEDLFDLALAFAYQSVPTGERLLIVTNAGGPGILSADTAERLGVPLATVTTGLRDILLPSMPPTASLANPVDVIGDARADRYEAVFKAVRDADEIDSILILLTPQAMTQPLETAQAAVAELSGSGKTVVASFLGETSVAEARKVLSAGGIPNYPVPERAVKALYGMLRHRRYRSAKAPEPVEAMPVRSDLVREALKKALAEGCHDLGEEQSRGILEAYGFSFPRHAFASTSVEAVTAFRSMGGGPVVMKIVSPEVLHKTDVGGVKLNLTSDAAVAQAFVDITSSVRRRLPNAWIAGVSVQEMVTGGRELIVGMNRDPQFGPLLMFGLGGIHVELLKDVSFRVAPLSQKDAVDMIREIRSYRLLSGFRGSEPADEQAIVSALLTISRLALDFPQIQELDINPILVLPKGKGLRAIDSRMTVSEART